MDLQVLGGAALQVRKTLLHYKTLNARAGECHVYRRQHLIGPQRGIFSVAAP
jgi:hypothetical protein